jgi:hypothetical protein
MEGENWGDMEGVSTAASLRDLDIDGGEAGSLMSTAIGLQVFGVRIPGRDGDLSLHNVHTGSGAALIGLFLQR